MWLDAQLGCSCWLPLRQATPSGCTVPPRRSPTSVAKTPRPPHSAQPPPHLPPRLLPGLSHLAPNHLPASSDCRPPPNLLAATQSPPSPLPERHPSLFLKSTRIHRGFGISSRLSASSEGSEGVGDKGVSLYTSFICNREHMSVQVCIFMVTSFMALAGIESPRRLMFLLVVKWWWGVVWCVRCEVWALGCGVRGVRCWGVPIAGK